MKFEKFKEIEGQIEVITGLHIGSNVEQIEIGGLDNPVIRHLLTKEPYIPGSSLKGRMRALLEWRLGKVEQNGAVYQWCKNNDCPICRIFGTSADAAKIGPTRLIVRDAYLTEEFKKDKLEERGMILEDLTEEKWENSINRLTASANPRPLERVIPTVKFQWVRLF
ncbi:type III-A CRISPR-associated RAMP protein Csm3 [candidate division KSB1 bacterium]|nr:type III-A CRISPR-associated RAMP protein Csm3 [candidate division KSB1 bacterium]NIR73280.1 type III-A CRISPR-associated RAMP protein Csm3 [candidate division KSB1 bacterium]NIS26986.1 type III-A CRISPR-associated RAMP protein Csm3 [candidate division KSB1 bacterium]NIT73826.1 type III-A CRISPR-associated RAMP protein Csm3 [candidate division KSB1 bacterium]NIU27731.1 type III-A CRISPR-associated RAMP protein Csm3 [candidate division KSB1 bacterium]